VSDFDIFLDTDNELKFTVAIEGVGEASVRSQFILEGPKGINLSFEGKAEGSEISVDVPSLKGMLREGLYNTRLEVIVDDRIFTPLQMQATLKPAIKVEAVIRATQKVTGPVVSASVVSRPKALAEAPVVQPVAPVAVAPVAAPAPAPVAPRPPAAAPSTTRTPSTTRAPSPAKAPRTFKSSGLDSLLSALEQD
jgi:hypothetical protein